MRWLNINIEIETGSIFVAILIFSILSGVCSIFTILIFIRIKQLRTIIYRFFFHVAINEIISRLSYLMRAVTQGYVTIFRITCFITYLADTNILILVSFTCFGMYQLLLKQNTKLANKFNKISIILYSISVIITIVFYILSINDDDIDITKKDTDLNRNIISLNFIRDDINGNLKPILFTNIVYYFFCLISLVIVIIIQIFIKDRSGEDDKLNEEKKITSALKFRTFRVKLLSYPILNFAYVLPLTIYGWIEYVYLSKMEDFGGDMIYLKVRYLFFNIYCFLNSIRGLLFFNVFIMNEKIKKFLFRTFLNFEIFKTIDKIKEAEENSKSSRNIESRSDSLERELTFSAESSYDYSFNKNKIVKKRKPQENKVEEEEEEDDDENDEPEKKLIEMDINDKDSFNKAGLINEDDKDSDDEEDVKIKAERDIKSETMKNKKFNLDD